MHKIMITAAVAAGACAIAVPSAFGLAGNPSFNQHIKVRAPQRAAAVTFDARGHAVEHAPAPGATPTPTTTPTTIATPTRPSEPGDDRGTHTEPGDDRGTHTEPGDDRGTRSEPGDDRGRRGGSAAATPTGSAPSAAPSAARSSDDYPHGDDDGPGHGRHGSDG